MARSDDHHMKNWTPEARAEGACLIQILTASIIEYRALLERVRGFAQQCFDADVIACTTGAGTLVGADPESSAVRFDD